VACMGTTLGAVGTSSWVLTNQAPFRLLQALLVFSLDPRPTVRHAARKPLATVLAGMTEGEGIPKPVSEIIARYALREISEASAKNCQAVLLLCGLLSDTLPLLPPGLAASVLEPLLRLAAQGNPRLLVQTLITLEAQFVSLHTSFRRAHLEHAVPAEPALRLCASLLSALLELSPHPSDIAACAAYMNTSVAGVRALATAVPAVGSAAHIHFAKLVFM